MQSTSMDGSSIIVVHAFRHILDEKVKNTKYSKKKNLLHSTNFHKAMSLVLCLGPTLGQ
jgi:hypothetical protein